MKKLILLGVSLSLTMAGVAGEKATELQAPTSGTMRIDLATALKLARARNSDIALTREAVKQSGAQLKQKEYLLIPTLSFGAS